MRSGNRFVPAGHETILGRYFFVQQFADFFGSLLVSIPTIFLLMSMKFLKKLKSFVEYRIIRFYHEKIVFKTSSKELVFTSIWRNNYWGSNVSVSGPGSSLESTEEIRKYLPIMFKKFNINSVFDAPCGDLHWMHHILIDHHIKYLGGDIVREIVESNASKFSYADTDFVVFDITANSFPASDVWLCRAVFYHLSNLDILHALEQFVSSDIQYILTTNHVTNHDHVNKDILTGDWRLLDLRKPPFSFPIKAEWEVFDYVQPHPVATLTMWKREDILELMPSLRLIYQK